MSMPEQGQSEHGLQVVGKNWRFMELPESKASFHHKALENRATARRIAHKRGESISIADKRYSQEWGAMIARSPKQKRIDPDKADVSGLLKEAAFSSRGSFDAAISLLERARLMDQEKAKTMVQEGRDLEPLLNPMIHYALYEMYEAKWRGRINTPTRLPRREAIPLRLTPQR